MADFSLLQQRLGIAFQNPSLLQEALVHRSYLNENPQSSLPSNERLEFLGDALLGYVVAEHLFLRSPPLSEGELTHWRATLVQQETLARLGARFALGAHLYLGRGEERNGGRSKRPILAGAFEALVGAILVDQGTEVARDFVLRALQEEMEELGRRTLERDYKSRLQELVQAAWKQTPFYRTLAAEGPDHAKAFTVEVVVGERSLASGRGGSKHQAEQSAAQAALAAWPEIEAQGRPPQPAPDPPKA